MEKTLIINFLKDSINISESNISFLDQKASINLDDYNKCIIIVNKIEDLDLHPEYKNHIDQIKTSILLITEHNPKKLEQSDHKSNFDSILSGIDSNLKSTLIEISKLV